MPSEVTRRTFSTALVTCLAAAAAPAPPAAAFPMPAAVQGTR